MKKITINIYRSGNTIGKFIAKEKLYGCDGPYFGEDILKHLNPVTVDEAIVDIIDLYNNQECLIVFEVFVYLIKE
jgi:pyridoxal biosynthesis lyase PdxS